MSDVRTTVSHSEAESYLRCERAHYYGYILEIQRRETSDSLARGTIGHSALEIYFKKMKDIQDSNADLLRDEFGTVINGAEIPYDEAVKIAKEYVKKFLIEQFLENPTLAAEVQETLTYFFQADRFKGWTILSVEDDYMFEVDETLQMPYKPDLIAMDPEGKIWLIDHKFVYDFFTARDAELQPQLAKYAFALRKMGKRVDKIGYHSLRYRRIKESTVENRNSLLEFPLSDARATETMREQVFLSRRLQERKQLPLAVASNTAMRAANKMVCNNCSFRSLCLAELNQTNPQLVLDSEYVKRERIEYEGIDE